MLDLAKRRRTYPVLKGFFVTRDGEKHPQQRKHRVRVDLESEVIQRKRRRK